MNKDRPLFYASEEVVENAFCPGNFQFHKNSMVHFFAVFLNVKNTYYYVMCTLYSVSRVNIMLLRNS